MGNPWKALGLAVVPGLGHLYLGRRGRGLFVLALFAVAANGVHLAATLESYADIRTYGLCLWIGAAVSVWLYSIAHVAYLSRRFESRRRTERKEYHFKRGLTQYLSGSFDAARGEFRTVLRLDPLDVDARFHLGMTHAALGRRRDAVKAFKRCLADDVTAKWRWEVKREIERLRQRA